MYYFLILYLYYLYTMHVLLHVYTPQTLPPGHGTGSRHPGDCDGGEVQGTLRPEQSARPGRLCVSQWEQVLRHVVSWSASGRCMYASSADLVHITVLLYVCTYVSIYSVYVAYLLCSIMVHFNNMHN